MGYQLKWKDNPFSTFGFMINKKHDQLFEPVSRDNRTLAQVIPNRVAFQHLSKVANKRECFTECLDTWMKKFIQDSVPGLYKTRQNLCRFVTIRPVHTKHRVKVRSRIEMS